VAEDRRIRKTKQAIKETLIELLQQTPIDKITVTELTRQADISRKTFYLHYPSVYEAKNDVENDIIRMLDDIIAPIPNFIHENDLLSFFKQIHEKAAQNKRLVAYFSMHAKQSDLYNKVKAALKNAVMTRLESSNRNNKHNEYLTEFAVSGILNSFIEWNAKRDLPAEDFSLLLTNVCSALSEQLVNNDEV